MMRMGNYWISDDDTFRSELPSTLLLAFDIVKAGGLPHESIQMALAQRSADYLHSGPFVYEINGEPVIS
jgi:hypothetical protein